MARALNDITQELRTNFMANETIQSHYDLAPGAVFEDEFSIVSFEAILFHIIAVSIWTLEKIFDDHKTWMAVKESELKPWNLPSLVANAKKFQLGDDLVYQDDAYKYATIDTETQIVKLASASEVGNIVVLKVAKLDGSGVPEKLDETDELGPFVEYIKLLKPPGVKLSIVSRDADLLKIYYRVYINPLVMNASGELLSDTSVKPVEDAINAYCKGLNFNGVFSVTELTDKIQQATGVSNPVFESAASKYGLTPYAAINDYFTPNAGYFKIDEDFPLSATITYLVP
jgi:hypothetical protein